MDNPRLLRLAAARMVAALGAIPDDHTVIIDGTVLKAADVRAELADPARVTVGTVARVSGLCRTPAHQFFEKETAA